MKSTPELSLFSSRRMQALAVLTALLFAITGSAAAQTEISLYGFSQGTSPTLPISGVVRDAAGNLYGTTQYGDHISTKCPNGCGTVFELSPAGTLTILHAFTGAHDGANPWGSLVRDLKGNLYGTTVAGGASNAGTAFRVSADGSEKVLYTFTGGADGSGPYAGLLYVQGTLYGTTAYGGTVSGGCGPSGCGTVFKITPDGTETVLHAFGGDSDGKYPESALIRDAEGNLYGTTAGGGTSNLGTVFKIDTAGTESVLYTFAGGTDGAQPWGTLVRGTQGDLYGTTFYGGHTSSNCTQGCGTVFHLAPNGVETVMLALGGGSQGANPQGGLVRDSNGNFYGTAFHGGLVKICKLGCGTIFEVTRTGKFINLHSFGGSGNNQGQGPRSSLISDGEGNFYGTTDAGGFFGGGEVFKFTP